ncbi:MAG: GatB/YqeY domain-containing protein [Acidimicrobiales bacterium]
MANETSPLLASIREDLKVAMKARDAVKLRTLRSVISAVQEAETAGTAAVALDDDGVLKVIAAQAKRRVEAAEAFEAGGRVEAANGERDELVVLESYLPAGLSEAELIAIVEATLAAEGFTTKADMGQAMKRVNAEVAGRADGRTVADLVKSRLV